MTSPPSHALVATVFAALFAAAPSAASTIDVGFDGEIPFMNVANGYTSSDTSLISFSDTVGANLQLVTDPLRTNGSTALAVFTDHDDSALLIEFEFLASMIRMDIGNDSPLNSAPGDTALLTLFLGGAEVDSVPLVLNRNFAMDQSIGFDGTLSGVVFDSATLKFDVDPSLGLIEVVDNVSVTPVPEATAATIFGTGSLVVGLACRHAAALARVHNS
jgi:hypothetical protein